MRFNIRFVSRKYNQYVDKYDSKSLLWITYFIGIWLLVVWIFINIFDIYIIPEWLITLWIWIIAIPTFLTISAIILASSHGLFYLICLLLGFSYKDSLLSKRIEILLKYSFPKKLYVSKKFTFLWKRHIEQTGIYYGVILNIFILICVLVFLLFICFPEIRSWFQHYNGDYLRFLKWFDVIQRS